MTFVKPLSRDEMKNVMAGNGNECAIGCNNFGSDCYESCINTFEPHEDLRGYCVNTCKTQVDNCLELCFA